ncbi:ribonuclease III, partial [Pleomassaria siparia CBS 279.74]
MFDAAKQVHAIEEKFGYVFKNKLLCVEALKMSGTDHPIYFDGTIHPIVGNNRLALLGDRALSLSLTELWFKTGQSTKTYSTLNLGTITRVSLAGRGHKIGLGKNILRPSSATSEASINQVGETFEAVLGAVYVDSGYSLQAVTAATRRLEVDD